MPKLIVFHKHAQICLHQIFFPPRISSGQRMLGQHDINLRIKEDSTPYAATVVHPGLQPEFRDSYGMQVVIVKV